NFTILLTSVWLLFHYCLSVPCAVEIGITIWSCHPFSFITSQSLTIPSFFFEETLLGLAIVGLGLETRK
ncbi:hypothetical protein, partial [Wolbachia endosymbiont of Wuchereria bancrofti]|uniref:hypothetical protein n=1 Tax=Wolbachia endosymbiont of Wuchereria bancrofti TaxID=96496 RepID=UPI001C54FAD7